MRRLINTLDGFSTYAPIWLRFAGRINVADLACRQAIPDAAATPHTRNDAVYLVNLDARSQDYGQPVPLDFGTVRFDALGRCSEFALGRFPATLERSDEYFANDPRGLGSNLLFETYVEDLNDNGVLDPGEDTDFDRVLDRPNLWGELLGDSTRMDPYRDLVTFYELETDTLLIRPVFPLAERTTYAVIITRRLVGDDSGSPVRPPFATINHVQQTSALRPLVEDGILGALGITLDDVAFTWSFTTQSITADVEAIRAGLYGHGPLARLAAEFPPRLIEVSVVDTPAHTHNVYFLRSDRLLEVLEDPIFLSGLGFDVNSIAPTVDAYRDHIAGFVFGVFESPALIENTDGAFRVDARTGFAEYGREQIPIVCAVPYANRGAGPPFPVAFYGHGYTSARFEMLGFAAALGRFGLATCAIDAYHHGAPDSEVIRLLAQAFLGQADLAVLADVIFTGRARDFNSDGAADSGVDFFTANP
ncbi:MAG: hypothetical protein HYZ27_10560, partial [Deltaproteobacteria bacterium]|nr:hypothetical protein [Deltaproteobacteria bacterium]